jgi:hypothetical protein
MHEITHIYDVFTPSWSTDSTDLSNGYMLSSLILNAIEIRTELVSMELMMPIHQFQDDLFKCSYDIEVFVKPYNIITINTILRWLTINDYYNAHFAVLQIVKKEEKKESFQVDEYCRDKNAQDIYNIISNMQSIAYYSIMNEEPKSGKSIYR